jgi:hypothetical protein
MGVRASGLGGITGYSNLNNFSIYGPLAPYLTGNPLSGLFKYNDEAWKINNKGSLYGWFAGILNHPMNPFSHIFYTWDKFAQAGQKAWRTGNVWDFFNYPFYRVYGYSNLDKMWGGQNIKTLLDWGFGIDEKGDLSVGGFLLLLFSIIPIGRVVSVAGKALSRILSKAGLKVGVNLAENWSIRKFGNFLSD